METDAVCNRDFQYIDSNTKKQNRNRNCSCTLLKNTWNKEDNIMRKLKRGWGGGGGGGGVRGLFSADQSCIPNIAQDKLDQFMFLGNCPPTPPQT